MPDMEYSFMLEQDLITASAEDDIICAAAYAGEELAAGTFKTDFQRTSFTSCRFAGCDFSGSSFFRYELYELRFFQQPVQRLLF